MFNADQFMGQKFSEAVDTTGGKVEPGEYIMRVEHDPTNAMDRRSPVIIFPKPIISGPDSKEPGKKWRILQIPMVIESEGDFKDRIVRYEIFLDTIENSNDLEDDQFELEMGEGKNRNLGQFLAACGVDVNSEQGWSMTECVGARLLGMVIHDQGGYAKVKSVSPVPE